MLFPTAFLANGVGYSTLYSPHLGERVALHEVHFEFLGEMIVALFRYRLYQISRAGGFNLTNEREPGCKLYAAILGLLSH
jgi:hypothetical protein